MKLLRMPGASGSPVYIDPDDVVVLYPSNLTGAEDLTKTIVHMTKAGANVLIQVGAHVDRVAKAIDQHVDIPVVDAPAPAPQLRAIPTAIKE